MNKDENPQIDEARWKAWEDRGRAKSAASARGMQKLAWILTALLVAWAYYSLSL